MMRLFVAVATAIVLAVTACAWYVWHQIHTPAEPMPGTIVSVAPGASLRSVADQLRRARLVRHPALFIGWARFKRGDRAIRSGTYHVEQPISAVELLDLLLAGPTVEPRWVTIPEGHTAAQVVQLLEKRGFGGADVFQCLMTDPALLTDLGLPGSGFEGYIFPDTYALDWTSTPEGILRTMVRSFRRIGDELAERRTRAGMTEVEMVTLASVIEKETGKGDERAMISGVFHNRLRLGIPLQSDPTVIYGVPDFDGNLTREHLDDPTPYNTYRQRGLPPGPIANPGRAALEAAVSPSPTSALFFVSRNDGSHEFSTSLAEHNRAVRRYQKRIPRGLGTESEDPEPAKAHLNPSLPRGKPKGGRCGPRRLIPPP